MMTVKVEIGGNMIEVNVIVVRNDVSASIYFNASMELFGRNIECMCPSGLHC